jgi:malate permease and related proteins
MNLSSLASILINIILPIVLVVGAGFLVARTVHVQARDASRLMMYVFTPALIFSSTYRTQISGEYISIALFALIMTALMGAVAWIFIRGLRYDRLTASAFALGVLFVNSGNYGLPVLLFAYGQDGLARGVIYFTVGSILMQTLAIFIAARGRAAAREAMLSIFKLPLVYAVALGLILNRVGLVVPAPMMQAVDLTGNAAVPVMLVILGIELAGATLGNDRSIIGIATVAKLIVAPLLAFPLAMLMGLPSLARNVCIVEASMPAAVLSSIIAVEFDVRPKLVTGIVFASTVLSIVTLTVLLVILK